MSLTRGPKGLFPCPICLVPKESMCSGVECDIRTTKGMKKIYKEAEKMETAKERNNHLKSFGLCGIKVCGILT